MHPDLPESVISMIMEFGDTWDLWNYHKSSSRLSKLIRIVGFLVIFELCLALIFDVGKYIVFYAIVMAGRAVLAVMLRCYASQEAITDSLEVYITRTTGCDSHETKNLLSAALVAWS